MRSLDEIIEEIVTWMALARPGKNAGNHGVDRLPLMHFDGAEPFTAELVPYFDKARHDYHRLIFAPGQVKAADLNWSFDWTGIIDEHRNPETDKYHGEQLPAGKYILCRTRTVPLKSVRGLFKLTSEHVVERSAAFINEDGSYWTRRWWCQYSRGKWQICEGLPEHGDDLQIEVACSICFSRDYEWVVKLGYAGLPSIKFVTDPAGARAVFRLRDIPEGRARREALRHWVKSHWRAIGKAEDATEEIKIAEFLRGQTKFNWNGLTCEIIPSAYDIRKAKEAKESLPVPRPRRARDNRSARV